MDTSHRRTRRVLALVSAVGGFLLSAVLVWQGSHSAFTATTTNGTNTWSNGTVTLSSTPSSAMFTATNLKPGSTGTACVTVQYTGSLSAGVRLYVAPGGLTGTAGQYLTLQVNEGTDTAPGGNDPTCASFTKTGNDYNASGMSNTSATLSAFAAASTNYATGVGTWAPSGSSSLTYQFVWQLQDNNSAQGQSASATLTWEADSV